MLGAEPQDTYIFQNNKSIIIALVREDAAMLDEYVEYCLNQAWKCLATKLKCSIEEVKKEWTFIRTAKNVDFISLGR